MSEDQFIKLFAYMERRFNELDRKIDGKADKIVVDRIWSSVDGIAKELETDRQERTFMLHQLARHEKWFAQLAQYLHLTFIAD